MATGQDVRMTDIPYVEELSPDALVYINNNGALRQASLSDMVKYSTMWEQIDALIKSGTTDLTQLSNQQLAALQAAYEADIAAMQKAANDFIDSVADPLSKTEAANTYRKLAADPVDVAFAAGQALTSQQSTHAIEGVLESTHVTVSLKPVGDTPTDAELEQFCQLTGVETQAGQVILYWNVTSITTAITLNLAFV